MLSIFGPTGTGKSQIALLIAERLNGSIISCDSMMVYRGLDIGTAKPPACERKRIPHYIIDILDIKENYSAFAFTEDAHAAIIDCKKKNRIPVVCGGTGLYGKALLYDYSFYPADAMIAAELKGKLERVGQSALVDELAAIDPKVCARVAHSTEKLLRALEIVRITKRPLSESSFKNTNPKFVGTEIILEPDPRLLRKRIITRTKSMLKNGWIEETESLRDQGLFATTTASKCLGYSQIRDFLAGGIKSKDQLQERLIHLTCQYAKRQRTWFRHQHAKGIVYRLDNDWNEVDIANQIINEINFDSTETT